MRLALVLGLLIAALLLLVPTASFVYESGAPGACANCHEMSLPVGEWAGSAHRNVACAACHGDALTVDARFHMNNARRVYEHHFGDVAENARLAPADVWAILGRCQKCHPQEYATWNAGPHAVKYEPLFLETKHNTERHLMDDCLRCHGMHYDGPIRNLVQPLDNKGPWRFRDASVAGRPAIPCLSCHSIHHPGQPLKSHVRRAVISRREAVVTPSLAFYDRRTHVSVSVTMLPIPHMHEGDRAVKMSPDPRQALCYQCHAPLADEQVRSGDDRTPVGVHEGLSCLACHDKHKMSTRASCANCHPRLSNCGRDVETMDTTFFTKASAHNIHFMKCADCHPKGVPPRRNGLAAAR
jgi:hypothetical protein